jgi:hypothetical protein
VVETMLGALVRCARGHLELALERDARRQLDEARGLSAGLDARPESQLSRALAALTRAQEAFEADEPLLRGERADDVPDGLRRST